MGIVESLSMLPYNIYLEGTEVSDLLGITHYEPPTPQELNAKGILPFSMSKTDEERYQNIDLDQYIGEVVDVTLKVDGQSFTAYYDRETDAGGVCGRTMEYKLDAVNNYTANYRSLDLATKLKHFCIENECSIALRGEQYGKGIQNSGINPHCKLKLGVMFYNVLNLKTMKYEPPESPLYYAKVCEQLGLETVPTLEKNVILTRDTIKKYDEGITGINNNPFEGVVIKGNGFSFKVINKFYDSKK
jgi:RNA ligase (TIGR02306 family)